MLTPDNIITFMVVGLAVVIISAIIAVGNWDEIKTKRAQRQHNKIPTNYSRYQARLAVINEVIVKGTL